MKILYNNNDLNMALKNVTKLGFVPTMGGLHKGHFSLIKRSQKNCNKTIVSIFVNPKQFNNKKDYNGYPRNDKKDLLILKKMNVNFVYMPKNNDVFRSKIDAQITLKNKDKILCARFRKGHFEGVLNVMDRLTSLIKPKKIFMGEKDFQQLFLVKKYIESKYKSLIIPCKIIRDKNKLALSSRNLLLNNKELLHAAKLAQNLISFKKSLAKKKHIINLINVRRDYLSKLFNVEIDYLELRNKINLKKTSKVKNSRLFIAYYMSKVRLIDNF